MKCNKCGHDNLPGKKFCTQCQTSLGSTPSTAPPAAANDHVLIRMLEPWWRVQDLISSGGRRALSYVVTMVIGYWFGANAHVVTKVIGYWFGANASGWEWTCTFLSMISGSLVTFMLTFTPPLILRKPKP
jgi:hypothetical protein